MRMNLLPNIKTQTSYAHFVGGLDLVSPPLSIDAGKCISAMNYEANALGGYRRIDGYERFDGKPSPSDQSYYYCLCNFTSVVNVGDTLTGATSGKTGKVISITGNEVILSRVSGSLAIENFTVGGVVKGSFTTIPLPDGHHTGFGHATARHLTANDYRNDILAVPGSGVIRGVCMFKGVAYAFRNNTAGTEVDIYKSTSTGWQKITLFKSIPLKNGSTDIIDGVVVNQQQGTIVTAGSFVIGTQYMIDSMGTTNFVAIGAPMGSGAGSMFIATGVGSGTGTAYKVASAMVKRQVIESEYNQFDLEATSLTSVIIATGSKSITVEKTKAYKVNDALIITSKVNPLNYMIGTVTSYSNVTGVLVANISSVVGSGTFANWIVHGESTNVVNYSGRLILANVIGTFDNTGYIRVGIINVALPNGDTSTPVSQISILPGGNYQFAQNNFLASADTKRIYGTDSLNRAFEFDGDVYIPIRTQIAIDAPTQIAVVNNTGDTQLVLSYFGQVLFSAIGNPHDFRTTSLGFQDLGFGDTITGMSSQVGGVLAVFCRDSVHQAAIDGGTGLWISKLISPDLGAIHYGVLNLGGLYAFDDKGIVKIVPSYVFGGFEHDTVSRAIQPTIDKFREKIVATAAFKSKNQCRFYARDGSGICMTMAQGQNGIEHHFTQFQYPISVSYAWHGEDASGRDIVLIGDESGFVYVANKGSSFDGQEITAYIRTAFNNLKSPSAIKRFRKMEVEVSTVGYSEIRFNPDFSYADPDVATHIFRNETINGVGGYWDEALFNTFYYDGKIISQPEMRLFGSGTNIGLVIFSKSAIDFGHTLSGVILHYTPRKLNR